MKTPITGMEPSFEIGDKAYVSLPEENLLIIQGSPRRG